MTVVSDATSLTNAGIFAGGAVASGAMLRRGALVPKDTPPPAPGAVTTARAESSRERAR